MKRNKLAEINITPLVDVMLVLLVIFMVATPMMHTDVDVNLPSIEKSNEKGAVEQKDRIKVQILKNKILLKGNDEKKHEVSLASLESELKKYPKHLIVFVYADKTLEFEYVFAVLHSIQAAGFIKISIVGLKK